MKEMKASIEHKKDVISQSKERLEVKSNHLKHKKSELDSIMSETAKEEEFLTEKSAEYQTQIDTRLMAAYTRIRTSVRNGLAVVSIEAHLRDHFSRFLLKRRLRLLPEKIIIDEHSGRLVDSVLADEEEKKRWKNYFLNFIYLSPDKNRTFFYEKTIYFSSLNLSDYILILVPEKATQLAYTLFST
jgi:hypothetical protein